MAESTAWRRESGAGRADFREVGSRVIGFIPAYAFPRQFIHENAFSNLPCEAICARRRQYSQRAGYLANYCGLKRSCSESMHFAGPRERHSKTVKPLVAIKLRRVA